MKIAVPYENGEVYRELSRTEKVKVYRARGGRIVSCDVLTCNRDNIVDFLIGLDIDVLLCGSAKGCAIKASAPKIEVYEGKSGNTDAVVEFFLGNRLRERKSL